MIGASWGRRVLLLTTGLYFAAGSLLVFSPKFSDGSSVMMPPIIPNSEDAREEIAWRISDDLPINPSTPFDLNDQEFSSPEQSVAILKRLAIRPLERATGVNEFPTVPRPDSLESDPDGPENLTHLAM